MQNLDNLSPSVKRILTLLNVPPTKGYIEDTILVQPDYPSLLALSDTIEKYAIGTLAIKENGNKLGSLPLPCTVQVLLNNSPFFYTLVRVDKETVTCYDDKDKRITQSKNDFIDIWTGICLLGILFKNGGTKYDVIKVCNPYFGPCSKAHPILQGLVKNGKINLRIIFTAGGDINGPSLKPVKHFLAIDAQGNKSLTKKALDQWYGNDNKDYESFAENYPMNGELYHQDPKIEAMRDWCKNTGITHTPTIFINGFELPDEYSVEDLKGVLN